MKTVLFVDTTSNEIIKVDIDVGGVKTSVVKDLDRNRAQVVLGLIDELLKKNKLGPEDLSEIRVNCGPGSYTGIRVGLAVVNTLAFLLKIPVNGLPIGEPAEPVYSQKN